METAKPRGEQEKMRGFFFRSRSSMIVLFILEQKCLQGSTRSNNVVSKKKKREVAAEHVRGRKIQRQRRMDVRSSKIDLRGVANVEDGK